LNSQFCEKYTHNNLIRIRVTLTCKFILHVCMYVSVAYRGVEGFGGSTPPLPPEIPKF
jgi:hypothetical protein